MTSYAAMFTSQHDLSSHIGLRTCRKSLSQYSHKKKGYQGALGSTVDSGQILPQRSHFSMIHSELKITHRQGLKLAFLTQVLKNKSIGVEVYDVDDRCSAILIHTDTVNAVFSLNTIIRIEAVTVKQDCRRRPAANTDSRSACAPCRSATSARRAHLPWRGRGA